MMDADLMLMCCALDRANWIPRWWFPSCNAAWHILRRLSLMGDTWKYLLTYICQSATNLHMLMQVCFSLLSFVLDSSLSLELLTLFCWH